ncbi:hypothetical protein M407DRAFT_244572 [Tulasnella calospora MUT 4182]|uniref:Uncharacterized protein n=1 Tax=Tulasnella calospora MUT 4182 TaxID=1051891 RepID=A0A0C3Q4U3_9AGAM|nr:hypothetical protein M407DRAFT_244572 [Tulasnella calospora MUT 4182]
MLVSASKLVALLALVGSVTAAPQAVSATTSSVQQSSPTKTRTTKVQSAAPTATSTPLLYTLSQTGGIATEVTAVTVFNTFISGSREAVTTSFVETVTVYPENVTQPTPVIASVTPAATVSSSSQTTTAAATLITPKPNGALPRTGAGMGLAAIAVGVVAAVM